MTATTPAPASVPLRPSVSRSTGTSTASARRDPIAVSPPRRPTVIPPRRMALPAGAAGGRRRGLCRLAVGMRVVRGRGRRHIRHGANLAMRGSSPTGYNWVMAEQSPEQQPRHFEATRTSRAWWTLGLGLVVLLLIV